MSRSEFHEGQVPLKARGSCSWCWYSSRHIQRVWNILSAYHKNAQTSGHAWQATGARCAHPSAGGARQQESTSTWAAANLHPGCDSRPRGAAGRRAAASSTSALAPVLRRPALVALNARAVAPPPTVQGQPTLRICRASPPCASIHKACARASQGAHTPRAAPNSSAATSCMPDLL